VALNTYQLFGLHQRLNFHGHHFLHHLKPDNFPQININVQVDSTRVIAKKVVNREIDIAVVGGDVPEELKKVEQLL
jgi:calcineurin-like phosphoesterase family protein